MGCLWFTFLYPYSRSMLRSVLDSARNIYPYDNYVFKYNTVQYKEQAMQLS